jgi:hypothetical protein
MPLAGTDQRLQGCRNCDGFYGCSHHYRDRLFSCAGHERNCSRPDRHGRIFYRHSILSRKRSRNTGVAAHFLAIIRWRCCTPARRAFVSAEARYSTTRSRWHWSCHRRSSDHDKCQKQGQESCASKETKDAGAQTFARLLRDSRRSPYSFFLPSFAAIIVFPREAKQIRRTRVFRGIQPDASVHPRPGCRSRVDHFPRAVA